MQADTRAACGAAASIAAALLCACTPITTREVDPTDAARESAAVATDLFAYDPEARALSIGEPVPDFPLRGVTGDDLRLSDLRDRVVVMTFFAAGEGESEGEILGRFAEIEQSLGTATAQVVHLVSVLIDESPRARSVLASRAVMATREEVRWTFVRASPDVTAAIVAAFGVVIWQEPSGNVAHTFNTVVIDRRGRFADQFPGFDGWSPMDVIASASLAAQR